MQSICSVFLGLQSMTQIQYSYFHLWHCIGTHEISDLFFISWMIKQRNLGTFYLYIIISFIFLLFGEMRIRLFFLTLKKINMNLETVQRARFDDGLASLDS